MFLVWHVDRHPGANFIVISLKYAFTTSQALSVVFFPVEEKLEEHGLVTYSWPKRPTGYFSDSGEMRRSRYLIH